MDKKTKKIKLYHDQALELIKSYEGKTLIGKLVRSRQDIRDAYIKKAQDLLLKMIEIDETSPYIEKVRKELIVCTSNTSRIMGSGTEN